MSDLYYDTQGRPIEMLVWAFLLEQRQQDDDRWWRIGRAEIGDAEVSTVWIGIDHRFGDGAPLIYETMVFGGELDGEQERYSTWEDAERGHAAKIAEVEIALALAAR